MSNTWIAWRACHAAFVASLALALGCGGSTPPKPAGIPVVPHPAGSARDTTVADPAQAVGIVAVDGAPLEGSLAGPHARRVVWTPPAGPAIRLEMKGPRLTASHESKSYGPVHDASWPHGCGSVGSIRWTSSSAGKLTLTCNWADGPSLTFLRFRWNADEGELQLDESGVISGG